MLLGLLDVGIGQRGPEGLSTGPFAPRTGRQGRGQPLDQRRRLPPGFSTCPFGRQDVLAGLDLAAQVGLELPFRQALVTPPPHFLGGQALQPLEE